MSYSDPVKPSSPSNRWIFWLIGGLLFFGAFAFILLAMAVTRALDQRSTFAQNSDSFDEEPRIMREMTGNWSQIRLADAGVTLETPVLLRSYFTGSDAAQNVTKSSNYRGWYPLGSIDLYIMEGMWDAERSPDETRDAIEEWLVETPGVSDIRTHKLSISEVSGERKIFESVFDVDGFRMCSFTEVAAKERIEYWLTFRAFQEDRRQAYQDFERMVRSIQYH